MKKLNNKTLTAINNRLLIISVSIDQANQFYLNVDFENLKTQEDKEKYYYGAWMNVKAKLDQISLYKDHGIMMTAEANMARWIKNIVSLELDNEVYFNQYHDFKYPNRKAAA